MYAIRSYYENPVFGDLGKVEGEKGAHRGGLRRGEVGLVDADDDLLRDARKSYNFV